MRIAVVNLASVDGGGLSVLEDLHAFAGQHDEHEWLFVLGPQDLPALPHVRIARIPGAKSGPWGRLRAEMRDVPAAIDAFTPDVTLSLQNSRVRGRAGRQWVYLHQPLPFQDAYRFSVLRPGELDSALRQHVQGRFIKSSLRRADGVFVQTRWMQEAARSALGGTVPVELAGFPAPRPPSRPPVASTRLPSTFFYPAGPAIYKNFDRLHLAVRSLATQHPQFTVQLTVTEEEFRRLARVPEGDDLTPYEFLGRVSPERVDELYADSVLVFPSFIETLGLPLLEARVRGRFVIASDCAFAREVMAGYPDVVHVDPFDPQAWVEAMRRVLSGEQVVSGAAPTPLSVGSSWGTVLAAMENDVRSEQQ